MRSRSSCDIPTASGELGLKPSKNSIVSTLGPDSCR